MKRPGPNYRMSKSGKIYLAVTWARPNRTQRRRSLVQSELYGAELVKSKRDRDN